MDALKDRTDLEFDAFLAQYADEKLRAEFAARFLAAILSNPTSYTFGQADQYSPADRAADAVRYADALIQALQK